MRTVPLVGMSVVALLALAACGTESAAGPATSTSPSASPSATAGPTSLTVTVLDSKGAAPQSWTLTCDPTGGTHPDPAAACSALAAVPAPFTPVSPKVACTEIYGGDQTATIVGTYAGEPVDASYDRTNGCEIARWDALAPVLVIPGGV